MIVLILLCTALVRTLARLCQAMENASYHTWKKTKHHNLNRLLKINLTKTLFGYNELREHRKH